MGEGINYELAFYIRGRGTSSNGSYLGGGQREVSCESFADLGEGVLG